MSNHRALPVGFRHACAEPESPPGGINYQDAGTCRGCMMALVALAVNEPDINLHDLTTEVHDRAADLTLLIVRDWLDETDPLRVRAEQALVPLCAETGA